MENEYTYFSFMDLQEDEAPNIRDFHLSVSEMFSFQFIIIIRFSFL